MQGTAVYKPNGDKSNLTILKPDGAKRVVLVIFTGKEAFANAVNGTTTQRVHVEFIHQEIDGTIEGGSMEILNVKGSIYLILKKGKKKIAIVNLAAKEAVEANGQEFKVEYETFVR